LMSQAMLRLATADIMPFAGRNHTAGSKQSNRGVRQSSTGIVLISKAPVTFKYHMACITGRPAASHLRCVPLTMFHSENGTASKERRGRTHYQYRLHLCAHTEMSTIRRLICYSRTRLSRGGIHVTKPGLENTWIVKKNACT